MSSFPFPFLTAHWENLIVVNYEIPAETLSAFQPRGVELDFFEGRTFVSLVAFRFVRNKLFGLIPSFPSYSFEELNLRFYVRARASEKDRKGVAFLREFVPSRPIAFTARWLYEEPYEAVPMFHDKQAFDSNTGGRLIYGLEWGGQTHRISASTNGPLRAMPHGSLEEFILEHYWGYTRRSDGSTSEYEVRHPPWKIWDIEHLEVSENFRTLYGPAFQPYLSVKPHSAFIAQGSDISVHFGRRLVPKEKYWK